MRKLKLLTQISLDGFIADKEGNTEQFVWNWGETWTWDKKLKKDFEDLTNTTDCILLSRKMAVEGFVHHWARVAATHSDQAKFARRISTNKKIVFTSTLTKSEWENTTLAKGDIIEEVNSLKRSEGKDLIAYGGSSFISSLIAAELIDEYYLFVNPILFGKGMPIFDKIKRKIDLRLIEVTGYDCGVTVMKYDK